MGKNAWRKFVNILFLTSQIPNPDSGGTIRPFHLIKNFSENYNYNILLISFVNETQKSYVKEIEKYCRDIILFPIQKDNEKKIAIKTFLNALSPMNIASKIISKNGIFDISYFRRKGVQKEIDRFIKQHKIDVIYSDAAMAGYVANSSLPKIIEPLDINYQNWFHYFIEKNNFFIRIYWLIRTLQTFYRETIIFRKFDYCIVVTETDKNYINKFLSNILVIPNGTDIHYFKPKNIKAVKPSIVFTGVMNGGKNVEAVLYFYSNIYPIVKRECPNIKFYIVGKNPSLQIRDLTEDPSVSVTGFVEDIRPFLEKSSVYVCPHVSGSGIKNKVLEAMAMEKPVVSTSIGALGINFDKSEIIIADEPEDFANAILKLLKNVTLRDNMGKNARKLIIEKYSWDKCCERLNEIIKNSDKTIKVYNYIIGDQNDNG